MFTEEPNKRITLKEIKEHPWYNGPVCTQEEAVQAIMT